ncbi:MAG: DUF1987 domain-containing protein [Bacteroidales bacterium]|nr:DUF1987 domain-containing protein [Bacteroidales bacterium]
MKDLLIQATKVTPLIDFKANGKLFVEGKVLPEDPISFFNPVFEWLKEFHSTNTLIEVKLEYLNTSSSKQVFEMLRILDKNHENGEIQVKWYYEEGDYDILESGKYYESMIKMPFEYIEYAETDQL